MEVAAVYVAVNCNQLQSLAPLDFRHKKRQRATLTRAKSSMTPAYSQ